MKNKIKRIAREITMLSISFACGLFIFIGVMSVYATWDSPGDALTKADYMDLVDQVKSWTRENINGTISVKLADVALVNMNDKQIKNMAKPIEPQDAATKAYVDDWNNAPAGTLCGLYMITQNNVYINKPCMTSTLDAAVPTCPTGFTYADLGYFEAGGGTRAWRTCVKN